MHITGLHRTYIILEVFLGLRVVTLLEKNLCIEDLVMIDLHQVANMRMTVDTDRLH